MNEGQNIKVQMESMDSTIEELVWWQEEHVDAPKNLTRLNHLDKQCHLFACSKYKARIQALKKKDSNIFYIFVDIGENGMKII